MRNVMRRGNFASLADIKDKQRRISKYYNDTMAHPFTWTYTGKPTTKHTRVPFRPPHRRTLWQSKVKTAKQTLS